MTQFIACKWCNQIKPETDFSYESKKDLIRKHYCSACDKARQKAYYEKNKEILLLKKKQDYSDNRELYLDKRADYRKNNPEKVKASLAKWIEQNPEKVKTHSKKRKAVIRGAEAKEISPKEIQKLLSSPCFYCGNKDNIQIDHIFPISRGGKHQIGNLVAACKKCNMSKNKWFVTEWRILRKRAESF
jgi:5-methylcytosine-specific restriction endonuclease McrA